MELVDFPMKVCPKCSCAPSSNIGVCSECGYEIPEINGFPSFAPESAFEGGGFKPEYFEQLSKLEVGNFWFRARNDLIIWAIARFVSSAKNFLEIGCGTGFVLSGLAHAYPELALYGTEIFVAGLPFAKSRVPGAHFMQMDARHIPFVEEYDVIGAFDVLEHIEEDEIVLGQLYRALTASGILLVTVPQHPSLWSASDDLACHVRRYTASEIGDKARRAGFVIERSTSFVSLLLPAMLVSRLRHRKAASYDDVAGEFRLPKALNEAFAWVMRFEKRLIRLGINFPVGGSRLVVLRKEGSGA